MASSEPPDAPEESHTNLPDRRDWRNTPNSGRGEDAPVNSNSRYHQFDGYGPWGYPDDPRFWRDDEVVEDVAHGRFGPPAQPQRGEDVARARLGPPAQPQRGEDVAHGRFGPPAQPQRGEDVAHVRFGPPAQPQRSRSPRPDEEAWFMRQQAMEYGRPFPPPVRLARFPALPGGQMSPRAKMRQPFGLMDPGPPRFLGPYGYAPPEPLLVAVDPMFRPPVGAYASPHSRHTIHGYPMAAGSPVLADDPRRYSARMASATYTPPSSLSPRSLQHESPVADRPAGLSGLAQQSVSTEAIVVSEKPKKKKGFKFKPFKKKTKTNSTQEPGQAVLAPVPYPGQVILAPVPYPYQESQYGGQQPGRISVTQSSSKTSSERVEESGEGPRGTVISQWPDSTNLTDFPINMEEKEMLTSMKHAGSGGAGSSPPRRPKISVWKKICPCLFAAPALVPVYQPQNTYGITDDANHARDNTANTNV